MSEIGMLAYAKRKQVESSLGVSYMTQVKILD